MYSEFMAYIKPFAEKLENLLKFGKVLKVNGSNGKLQNIQLKTLRNIEDAIKVGQFGFNSKAPGGSRVVVGEISNEKIVIANEHIASILDVSSGNTIIYNESGNYIKIEDDTITLSSPNIISNCQNFTVNASTKTTFNSPLSEFSDNVNTLGLLSASSYSGLNGSDMTTNVSLETTQNIIADNAIINGKSVVGHNHGGMVPSF